MEADAIVIGAGAAGLAAARSLSGRSLRVIVLEARDRVGGRAWSHPVGTVPSAELGAEFIHGPAPATTAVLREAGIAATSVRGEFWICGENGLQRDRDDFRSSARIFEQTRSLAHDLSVDQFLRRFDADAVLRPSVNAARAFVEGFDAADPAIASARAIADEWRSGVDVAAARPGGGYGPMFEHLRNACAAAGVRLRLSSIVRRISWRRGAVAVDALDADGKLETVRARCAIVALPVGVLRHAGDESAVVFDPELPAANREGLRLIEMGHATRVVLSFRTPFWEQVRKRRYREAAFFRCNAQPFSAYWTQLPVRSRSIVAWAGGPKAIALRDVSPTERVELALSGFGTLLTELEFARGEFEGGLTHDWVKDPFARGAYSYVAVGGGNARAALAAPVDDALFFAGEATSSDGEGGTVNGALETGERAAREAAASLQMKAEHG